MLVVLGLFLVAICSDIRQLEVIIPLEELLEEAMEKVLLL
jgi:hypothetical protein